MDKLQTRIRAVEEEHAQEIVADNFKQHDENRKAKAFLVLGGFLAVDKVTRALSSELMRAMIKFQEEKLYEPLGFDNFVDFLNNSDYAPMTKNQFYERKAVLEKEGDHAFDLLNNLGLPVQKRKLLGAGNVQIEGDKVIVTSTVADGAAEKTETIEINNRERLLQVLSALADQNAVLNQKTSKQREKIAKGETEIEDLQKKLDAGSFTGKSSTAHFEMYMQAITPLNQLIQFVGKLSAEEKEEQGIVTLRSFNVSLARLAQAYGRKDLNIGFDEDASNSVPAKKGKNSSENTSDENEFASITSDLNDDELEELMD